MGCKQLISISTLQSATSNSSACSMEDIGVSRVDAVKLFCMTVLPVLCIVLGMELTQPYNLYLLCATFKVAVVKVIWSFEDQFQFVRFHNIVKTRNCNDYFERFLISVFSSFSLGRNKSV